MLDALDSAPESSFRREGADVQLVQHRFFPRPAAPLVVAPVPGERGDHFRRAQHILGLIAGSGIGHGESAIDAIAITRAGRCRRERFIPALLARRHGEHARSVAAFEQQLDLPGGGRPQAKTRFAAFDLCAKGKLMLVLHDSPASTRPATGLARNRSHPPR